MPELPEVEFARRSLQRWFKGRTLVDAEAEPANRVFRDADLKAFESLRGRLDSVERRGKYLMLAFSDGHGAVAHLGMTGKFLKRAGTAAEKWSRARLFLDSGDVIHFQDPRMFGRIEPMEVLQLKLAKAVAKLGIDPLVDGLTWQQLKTEVADSKQDLKVALMDQERIAGLGNIHAAEALFRARLHPSRKPKSLTDAEWKALCKAIHASIAFALKAEDGDEIVYVEQPGAKNPFLIYGRAGTPCKRCRTKVVAFAQGGRTTHVCPKCPPKRGGCVLSRCSAARLGPQADQRFSK